MCDDAISIYFIDTVGLHLLVHRANKPMKKSKGRKVKYLNSYGTRTTPTNPNAPTSTTTRQGPVVYLSNVDEGARMKMITT